jgi:hypothetical protein
VSQNPATYRLERIEDLAAIPSDRLEACLRDIQYAVELFHLGVGENPSGVKMGTVIWTDDGNHSIDMTLNGEPCLSLKVTDTEVEE